MDTNPDHNYPERNKSTHTHIMTAVTTSSGGGSDNKYDHQAPGNQQTNKQNIEQHETISFWTEQFTENH